jgi:ABC-type amino acid transport substrate-binding protein
MRRRILALQVLVISLGIILSFWKTSSSIALANSEALTTALPAASQDNAGYQVQVRDNVPPFVFDRRTANVPCDPSAEVQPFCGYSIDLIEEINKRTDSTSGNILPKLWVTTKPAKNVGVLINDVMCGQILPDDLAAKGKLQQRDCPSSKVDPRDVVDMGAAAISESSSRVDKVSFSMPIYNSSLSVAMQDSQAPTPNQFKVLLTVFERDISLLSVIVFLILFLGVSLFWTLVDKNNQDSPYSWIRTEEFFRSWFRGGWSVVTAILGHEHTSAVHPIGRILQLIVMIYGIMVVTFLTGAFSAEYTLLRQSSTLDPGSKLLQGKQLITVCPSTSYNYLVQNSESLCRDVKKGDRELGYNNLGLQSVEQVQNIEDALQKLYDGKHEGKDYAIVYDSAVLSYLQDHDNFYKNKSYQIRTIGSVFHKEYYAFIFPKTPRGDGLQTRVDGILSDLYQNETLDRLARNWDAAQELSLVK